MFSQSPGSSIYSASRENQIRASVMKLKRARWANAAGVRWRSVPKKMITPKIRWNESTSLSVVRSSLMHSEGVQHPRDAIERYPCTLLSNRQGGEKDRDQTVLSEGKTIAWMAGHFEHKLAISSLEEEISGRRRFYGKATDDEGSGGEAEVLLLGFAILPN